MEVYSQLLQPEAKGCRMHPTDFRGFLAYSSAQQHLFFWKKKAQKAKATVCCFPVCKYSSICKHLVELVEFSTSCTSQKEEDKGDMVW